MKRKAALLTAMVLSLSAIPMTKSTAFADSIIKGNSNIPSWVPQSYEEAIGFYNQYGVTHIEKGNSIAETACLVFPEDEYSIYNISMKGMAEEIYHETFAEGNTAYEVFAYYDDFKSPSVFEINYSRNYSYMHRYVFEGDGSGNLTETDVFSWAPDCVTEFEAFEKEYGTMSVHNGYVAYCQTSNPSTGYQWTWNESGDGRLAAAINETCTEKYKTQPGGNAVQNFVLLKPVKDGIANLNLVYEKPFEENSAVKTIDKHYLISENCSKIEEISNRLNLPELKEGEARVVLTDYDTGALIPDEVISSMEYLMMGTNIGYEEPGVPGGMMMTGPMYSIDNNPYYCDLAKFMNADLFEVRLSSTVDGYYIPNDGKIITKNSNNSIEIEFRLKRCIKGDSNGDGVFNISDVVMLQKCILGATDEVFSNCNAADWNQDGELNVFDLCMMKRELLNKSEEKYIEPDNKVLYGESFDILYENTKMYSGPGEEYPITAIVPKNETLNEIGYNDGNDDWVFTQYKSQYGWIKTEDVRFNYPAPAKPVIYLYPEEETDVHVELELKNAVLSTTYPKYNNGWDVTAYPDGSILNKSDGTHHNYLFWDAVDDKTRYDFNKGFCVPGYATEKFLKDKLTCMGLTEQEMNEFIVYWLPRMEHNAYNLISFQNDAYTENAVLNISPTPDSICRVFMAYIPMDNMVDIEPQQLNGFDRIGFTAVEWGGCEINR